MILSSLKWNKNNKHLHKTLMHFCMHLKCSLDIYLEEWQNTLCERFGEKCTCYAYYTSFFWFLNK
jgi:hypothetical protein